MFRLFRNTSVTTVPMHKYTKVVVSQLTNEKDEVVYALQINGNCVHSEVNSDAREFDNLIVYASDPWYNPANATIRNYKLTTPETVLRTPNKSTI